MDEIELKIDEKDSLLSSSNKGSKNRILLHKNSRFNVYEYDQSCEDHSKINKILTLKYSPIKFVFYIVFNILTFGIVNPSDVPIANFSGLANCALAPSNRK